MKISFDTSVIVELERGKTEFKRGYFVQKPV